MSDINFLYQACLQPYIRDQKGAGFLMNAVPITKFSSSRWRVYFPRPWLITGLVTIENVPDGATEPYWANVSPTPLSPADLNTYKDLLVTLFLDCAFADCEIVSALKPVNYIGPGPQGVDYRGYFTKFLNAATIATPQETFYPIVSPEAIFRNFIGYNSAATSAVYFDKWMQTIRCIEETSDVRWWGAPGIYEIRFGGSFDVSWTPERFYQIIENL